MVSVLVVKNPSSLDKADAFLIKMTLTAVHNKNIHVLSVKKVMSLRKDFVGLESAGLGRQIETAKVVSTTTIWILQEDSA